MERPRLVPQLYGYAVCLVCVITMLIAVGNLVDAVFDAGNPVMSREVEGPYGGSYEMYKMQRSQQPMRTATGEVTTLPLPPDSVLRAQYDAERSHRIAMVQYQAFRRLVSFGLLLVVAGALFAAHWRWLRRMGQAEAA